MKKTPAKWIYDIQMEAVKPLVVSIYGAIKSFSGAEDSVAFRRRVRHICEEHLSQLRSGVSKDKVVKVEF